MTTYVASVLVLFSACATSRVAWAWGDQAHQIVCEIAFQEIQPTTRQKVKDLIAQDPAFATFSESCVWPDHPRQRAVEHYINVPRTFSHIPTPTCIGVPTCLFTAIDTDSRVLEDPNASAQSKLESLKCLGHWVGDIHQPLHVSFADDRGGNAVDVRGSCSANLHLAWDICIVERRLGTDTKRIADALRKEITDAERAAWKSSKPVDWANDTYQLTISAPLGYCANAEGACRYDSPHTTLTDGMAHKSVTVDQAYIDANGPALELQLKKAGVRLATQLETTLGSR